MVPLSNYLIYWAILAGSLELAKEGNISIKQNKLFDDVFIKENKWKNLKKTIL